MRAFGSNISCKQSVRQWYRLIDSILKPMGFTRLQSDHSIYLCRRGDIIVDIALYIDNLQGATTNDEATWNAVKSKLSERLKMKDLGVARCCLGLDISQDLEAQVVLISQKKYFRGVLERFGSCTKSPVLAEFKCTLSITNCGKGFHHLLQLTAGTWSSSKA
jgi:hypothetical protein